MSGTDRSEAEFWNLEAGPKWVRHQAAFDALFEGVLARLLALGAPAPGEQVLDIGCGSGASAMAFAAAVGTAGRVTGLDISEPLLAHAETRRAAAGLATRIEYRLGDAQTLALEPGRADLVASRFGVMFFGDPVAAFANLRAATRTGGRLAFASWAGIEANPWFRLPRGAAIARLGAPAAMDPRAPGPFAFAEEAHVLGLLAAAGWSEPRVASEEVTLEMAGSAAEVAGFAVELGPAMRVVIERGGTETDIAAIAAEVAEGFAPFAADGTVRVPARVHFYSARAG